MKPQTPITIENINIDNMETLISPLELKTAFPLSPENKETIQNNRNTILNILNHRDPTLLFITGPCSIHDPDAALEYATRLKKLADKHKSTLKILMRVYFEKPRTSLGWRGLIIDPHLDGSYNMHQGLMEARRLLLEILNIGIPAGTEVLDPIIPQYIADLISWTAIGARTTESQIHREISSGLSMPVGFKNGTDGDLTKAVNAIHSAQHGHSFIGIDQIGRVSVIKSRGNRTGHLIMRGGTNGPNYNRKDIENAENLLSTIGTRPSLIIDCSHANSGKDPSRQSEVLKTVIDLRKNGHESIRGLMLESNLVAGRQDINNKNQSLIYGQSITDACINWEETEELIERTAATLQGLMG